MSSLVSCENGPNKDDIGEYVRSLYNSLVIPFDLTEYRSNTVKNRRLEKLHSDSIIYSRSYECIISTIVKLESAIDGADHDEYVNIRGSIQKFRTQINRIVRVTKNNLITTCNVDSKTYRTDNLYDELLTMSVLIINEYLSLAKSVFKDGSKTSSQEVKNNINSELLNADLMGFVYGKRVAFNREINRDNIDFLNVDNSIGYNLLFLDFDKKKKIEKSEFKSFIFLYISCLILVYGGYKINILPAGLRI